MYFSPYSKKLQHHVQLGSLLLIPTANTKEGPSRIIRGREEFKPVLTADVNFSSNLHFNFLFP